MRRFAAPPRRRYRSLTVGIQELEGRLLLSTASLGPSRQIAVQAAVLERADSLSRELTSLEQGATTAAEGHLLAHLGGLVDRATTAAAHHPFRADYLLGRVDAVLTKLAPGWSPPQAPMATSTASPNPATNQSQVGPAAGSSDDTSTPASDTVQSPVVTDPITDYTDAAQAWENVISTPNRYYLVMRANQAVGQSQFTMIPGVPDYAYNLREGTQLTAYVDVYQPRGGAPPGAFGQPATTPGPTVLGYTWDLSKAPDAAVVWGSTANVVGSSQPVFDQGAPPPPNPPPNHLILQWYIPRVAGVDYDGPGANPPMHLDTITVTANLSDGTQVSQTYTFYIVTGGADWHSEITNDLTGAPPVHPYPTYPSDYVDPNPAA